VQTFLPYSDFEKTAEVLDYRRLGKQRVETWQILNALNGKTKGWANHPASRMWRGFELRLVSYGIVICKEWIRRGYNDTMLPRFEELKNSLTSQRHDEVDPAWLGRPDIHISHQSNLVRKDPEFYGPLFPDVSPDLEYVWPVG
jgi:hypothetical protein